MRTEERWWTDACSGSSAFHVKHSRLTQLHHRNSRMIHRRRGVRYDDSPSRSIRLWAALVASASTGSETSVVREDPLA